MMSSGAAPSARLQVEIGDEAVLGAFDDVVGEALDRAGDRRLLFFCLAGRAAEMLGDGGDVKLVDGDLLFARLLAPIFGNSFECGCIGMTGGNRRAAY